MCKVGDLVILVVDSNHETLQRTCGSLSNIGIDKDKIICAHSYEEAISSIEQNGTDVDIVLADFDIDNQLGLGPLLCSTVKRIDPSLFCILTSKKYNCTGIFEVITHSAEDLFDLSREGEIEQMLQKWIVLAQTKNECREIVYGKKQPGAGAVC